IGDSPAPGYASGAAGVLIASGSLANDGTIIGGNGDVGGFGVEVRGGGTLINAGYISGGARPYSGQPTIAAAITFGSGASRLILDPGASATGAVIANASFNNVVELAAVAGAGTLRGGIGTQYQGFSTVTIDADADWTMTAVSSIAAGGQL